MKTAAAFFRGLAISPDESIVAVIASDGDAKAKTLRLYDIATERKLAHYDLGIENGDRLVFSPDGGSLLIGFYDGTALVFDVVAAIAGRLLSQGFRLSSAASGQAEFAVQSGPVSPRSADGPMTEEAMVYPCAKVRYRR